MVEGVLGECLLRQSRRRYLLDFAPAGDEPIAGELANVGALAQLHDAEAGHFVQLDVDVAKELHGSFDADGVRVVLVCFDPTSVT
jgi:hypothetical protein